MAIEGLLGDDRQFRRAAWLLLATSLAVRLWLSAHFFGFLTGDDVEILETGLRWTFDLGYRPWEIRNTLLPALLVAPMGGLGKGLGLDSPMLLAWLSTVPFALLSTLNVYLLFRLVRQLGGDRFAAVLASLLLGTHWVAVGYGSTVYPRTPATTCILIAALWALSPFRTAASRLGAGALVALGFAFRYSEGIFLLPLLLLASRQGGSRERLRSAAQVAAGFAFGTLLFVGLADLLEWGAPFASLQAFFEYTLVERKASALVVNQSWYWFLWRAPHWIPPAAFCGLWYFHRARVPRELAQFVLLPLVALSLVHHKELRYLQGILPFACAIGGLGLAGLWRAGWRRVVMALLAVTVGWSAVHLRFLEKKSMAAVEAAQYLISATPGLRQVALQQPWAFGDRLLLPATVGVRELPIDLRAQDISRATAGVDAVALYSDLITIELAHSLAKSGFCPERRFAWGRSREVSIYSVCPRAESLRTHGE